MKSQWIAFTLLALVALTLPGCGKSSSAGIDPSTIENSFASAEDSVKAAATKAVDAMKSADYNVAMAELLKLAADPKLTDRQKRAIAETLDQLKNVLPDSGKALGDAQKNPGK